MAYKADAQLSHRLPVDRCSLAAGGPINVVHEGPFCRGSVNVAFPKPPLPPRAQILSASSAQKRLSTLTQEGLASNKVSPRPIQKNCISPFYKERLLAQHMGRCPVDNWILLLTCEELFPGRRVLHFSEYHS